MTYIGIDPGKNGGLAILNGEEVQTFRRLFPGVNLIPPGCRKEHDGMAESLLLSLIHIYLRKKLAEAKEAAE